MTVTVTALHDQSTTPESQIDELTFCYKDFGHCGHLHSTLPLKSPINAYFNKLDGHSNFMAETVFVSNAIGEIRVGI
jgi:hypothetical protein